MNKINKFLKPFANLLKLYYIIMKDDWVIIKNDKLK